MAIEPVAQLLVLNYHHVHNLEDASFRVTPIELRAQLELLLYYGFQPIPFHRLADLLSKPSLAQKYVLVTFDDGYEDFLTDALPILEDLNVPAIQFIISKYVGIWNDWDRIRKSRHRHLTLDQLQELSRRGVEIGAHSHSHPVLTLLNPKDLKKEILGCKLKLEELLGVSIEAFAYPGGHFNWLVRAVTARYFRFGFAANQKAAINKIHPYQIQRFDPWDCRDIHDFEDRVLRNCQPIYEKSPSFGEKTRELVTRWNLFQHSKGGSTQ